MAVTTNVEFKLLYEDDTTSTINIGPISNEGGESILTMKSKIIAFMDNFNSDTALLSLSQYGNKWAGFDSVKIVTTDKNVIF